MHPFLMPPRPAWLDDLLAEVGRAFEATGARTPPWPDPHPDRNPPGAEYSRVSDPGKHQILAARADAWLRVLEAGGLATASEAAAGPWTDAERAPDAWRRVRLLAPTRVGGLSLLLADTLVDGEPFGLDVGLSDSGQDAPVHLDTIPSCGCDACDTGSDDLLEVLDGWILSVAQGGVLHARSAAGRISRTADGWQGSGDSAEFELWMDGSASPPPGVRRWVGASWV